MERIDDLQLKGLKLIQDTDLFCFGTDAVLLADFVKLRKNWRIVDMGTGTGILPILLYGRQPEANYVGIEIQPALAALARRNVAMNGIENNVRIVQGDIKDAVSLVGREYDVVVSNPPYEKANDGKPRNKESHSIARKELLVDFEGLCVSAAGVLREGGWFYVVHKASRLAGLVSTMKAHRLEPKIMRLVQTNILSEPKYVLLGAAKGGKEHMRVMPPLFLYDEQGNLSREHSEIYGRGEI